MFYQGWTDSPIRKFHAIFHAALQHISESSVSSFFFMTQKAELEKLTYSLVCFHTQGLVIILVIVSVH